METCEPFVNIALGGGVSEDIMTKLGRTFGDRTLGTGIMPSHLLHQGH